MKKTFPETLLVIILIFLFFIVGLTSIVSKSPTFDETVHLTGGYAALKDKDYRINPENGILPQKWAATPLLFCGLNGLDKNQPDWDKSLNWDISSTFLFKSSNDFNRMFLFSRIMMLLASCVTGAIVYFASKQLWGKAGAFISLGLFVLSPTIIANSRLITSDLFSTLFFFLSVWSFHLLLARFSIVRLLAMSFSISCLFLSKMSAPLIIPVMIIMIYIRLSRRKSWNGICLKKSFAVKGQYRQAVLFAGTILFAGFISFVAMWGIFSFRYSMLSDTKGEEFLEKRWNIIMQEKNFPVKTISYIRNYKILPEAYIYGLGYVLHKSKIRFSFLNGNYSQTGWWYFFPFTFALKTPLSILLLCFLGIFSLISSKKRRTIVNLKNASYLIVLVTVYIIFSLSTNLNIGHRHLMVIYPPLFVIAGGAAGIAKKIKFGKFVIYFLFAILMFENILIYPNYLTYFTPLCGGPKTGYIHLVDSSLDWGQELNGLKKWIKANNIPDEKVYISYFGSTDLTAYGLPQKRLFCYFQQNTQEVFSLKEGTYCISATMLQMVYFPEFAEWSEKNEKLLSEYKIFFQRLNASLRDEGLYKKMVNEKPTTFWVKQYRNYELLRFAKLAHSLRQKKPDHMIGNSILIYHLNKKDIENIIGRELEK